MNKEEINAKIKNCIAKIAIEQGIEIETIEDHSAIVDDLGLQSLDVATLVAMLEIHIGIDPFATGDAIITELRTVADLGKVYFESLKV